VVKYINVVQQRRNRGHELLIRDPT